MHERMREELEAIADNEVLEYRATAFSRYPGLEWDTPDHIEGLEGGCRLKFYEGEATYSVDFQETQILVRCTATIAATSPKEERNGPIEVKFSENLEPTAFEGAAEAVAAFRRANRGLVSFRTTGNQPTDNEE